MPEPIEASSSLSERSLTSANDEVRPIADTTAPKSKCQKTGQHFYSGEIHASISRYASINGPTAASHKFTVERFMPVLAGMLA